MVSVAAAGEMDVVVAKVAGAAVAGKTAADGAAVRAQASSARRAARTAPEVKSRALAKAAFPALR